MKSMRLVSSLLLLLVVLALDTGLCWLGEPEGTAIAYRVTVTVEPGHRQGTLRLPMRDWRELL